MSTAMDMRSLMLLLEDVTEKYADGVYCSARPTQSTIDALKSFCAAYDIPNPISGSEMHTTIIYSRQGNPDFTCIPEYETEIKAKFSGFDMFGKDKDSLVVKMKSPELQKRHKSMMKEFDLVYDFDEYIPHITLSYDAAGFDISKLDDYHGDLMFSGEDENELEKDWKPE